jgi:hypothetical protein
MKGGELLGEVDYRIDVFEDRRLRSGNGEIAGPFACLFDAFNAGSVMLRLESGGNVEVLLKRFNGADHSTIITSGPVPGF